MAITALPIPPSRTDPTNFATRADAFLGALPLFQSEANALQTDVNAKQTAAAASQTAAATSASNAATSASNALTSENNAAASATSALNAPGTNATSVTSMTIGTGSKAFTLAQTGKAYSVGQQVIIANTATPTNYMAGTITAFTAGTGAITVSVTATNGSGTFTAWTVSMTSPVLPASLALPSISVAGATSTATLSVSGTSTLTGNITYNGTAQRFLADFSNGTIANRVMFQTSTTNGNSYIGVLPNGTGAITQIRLYGNATPTNASYVSLEANGAVDTKVISGREGSGTYLPMTFYTNNTEQMRITTTGDVYFLGTGAIDIPVGTTAQRPASPSSGMIRYNTTLLQYEGHNGTAWSAIGTGATGAPGNAAFYENDQTITADYTITSGKNAMSAGPITINTGITVTVPSGSVWTIV